MLQDDGESRKSHFRETQVSRIMRARSKSNDSAQKTREGELRSLVRMMRGRNPNRLIGSLNCTKETLLIKGNTISANSFAAAACNQNCVGYIFEGFHWDCVLRDIDWCSSIPFMRVRFLPQCVALVQKPT